MSLAPRLPLAGGWEVWSTVLVRSAGFPAREVLGLAAPAAGAAADAVVAGGGTLAAYEAAFDDDDAQIDHRLRRIASEPRFREAVTWQNRGALASGIDRLLATPPGGRTRKMRNRAWLVARYLQRYCLKNDTIGFFGPVGWGRASREVAATTVACGPHLLARRTVYFEHWAIDAVARALARDPELRRQLAPRLLPSVALDGATLRYGIDRSIELEPAMVRLLGCCDGVTPASEIAARLAADRALELEPDEIYAALDDLAAKHVVAWTLEVPATLDPPDAALARLAGALRDPPRARATAVLARLRAARDEVAAAAGDPPRLTAALAALDTAFVEITGDPASRRAGQAYAGRTIVHEDTVRDVSVVVGRSVLDTLGPVLELVGYSARWYTSEIARRYRAALLERYRDLRATTAGAVGYARFFRAIAPLFPADESGQSGIAGEVTREVQRRWRELLGHDPAARRIERACSELAAAVHERFAAAGPGWPGARHLAPDVMIAARGPDALAAGELALVLGELHVGNTLLAPALLRQWVGEPGAIVAATERDAGTGRVVAVEARHEVTRADLRSWSATDLELELGSTPSAKPRAQVLRVAELVVEPHADSLVVVDRRSDRRFEIIAFLDQYLGFIASSFQPWPHDDHTPRITLGGVVVTREQWTFAGDALAFAAAPWGPAQFLACRRWARDHGLPRWLFARIPGERKPVFVDLASPLYVEILAKHVRRAGSVVLAEMLPAIDETWLPDAAGQTYTSELRLIVVDPVAYRPP